MHARIKLFVKVDSDEFQRNSGRKARRQEKLKNLKSGYPTGGKKARKGEVRQEQMFVGGKVGAHTRDKKTDRETS